MIKAVIVDDEELGRNVLSNLLRKYCSGITVVGSAGSLREAKKVIEEVNPSLVFLDIEMPGGSGFELLEKISHLSFSVIFTTAYDQYAVKAFKYSAVDYLLKPINIEELISAVKKAAAQDPKMNQESVQHLMESYHNSGVSKSSNKVALPTHGGLVFIDLAEIIHCEAEGKYTWCCLADGTKLHSTRSLKDLEEQLEQSGFCRVHHAHLISLDHIKSYAKGDGGQVTMSNGDVITVSKRKKEDFLKRLNRL